MSLRKVSRLARVMSDPPEDEQERRAVSRVGEDTPQGFLPMLATSGDMAANDLLSAIGRLNGISSPHVSAVGHRD